MQWTTTEI